MKYFFSLLFLGLLACNQEPKTEIKLINCIINSDCQEGQTCSESKCITQACVVNTDCQSGFLCVESQCIVALACRIGECPCSSNADCLDSERCDENQQCVQRECIEDIDCVLGAICRDGMCRVDVTADRDDDGVPDGSTEESLMRDNCPDVPNTTQDDLDMDGKGDACDEDLDGDSVSNETDNCLRLQNADQSNLDLDIFGDLCDEDLDGDRVLNQNDNCPSIQNEDQRDIDSDNVGDKCEPAFLNVCGSCPISYIDSEGSFYCGGSCNANDERCVVGSSRCKNGVKQDCSENYHWINAPCLEATADSFGEFCQMDDQGIAQCVDRICLPNQKNCDIFSEGSSIIQCNDVGSTKLVISQCPSGSICKQGSNQEFFCATQQCTANEEFCSANQILKCNSEGTSSTPSPRQCPIGFICAPRGVNDIDVPCIKACGNGIVNIEQGEECDDSNQNDQDNCTNQCKIAACGDGVLWTTVEECDQGVQNSNMPNACRNNCQLPKCGDGIVDPSLQEQCDDGNVIATDGCLADCRLPYCGDGIKSNTEECDDGDLNDLNTCSNQCKLSICGDSKINNTEECDDGNQSNTDACSNACKASVCGDGIIRETFEQCDQGALNSNVIPDRCRTDCSLSRCGDRVVDANEECDDGNLIPGDGCSPTCIASSCGDGFKESNEECDDGNQIDTDECTTFCKRAKCGDGFVRANSTEECDDANLFNDDNCLNTCKNAKCGDGFVNSASEEECDDRNLVDTDDCLNTCRVATCGDGIVQSGIESCDDGNLISVDACSNTCTIPSGKIRCAMNEAVTSVKSISVIEENRTIKDVFCFLQADNDVECRIIDKYTLATTTINPFPNTKLQMIEVVQQSSPFSPNSNDIMICGLTKEAPVTLNLGPTPWTMGGTKEVAGGHMICNILSLNSVFQVEISTNSVDQNNPPTVEILETTPNTNAPKNIHLLYSNGNDICLVYSFPDFLNRDTIGTKCLSDSNFIMDLKRSSTVVYSLNGFPTDIQIGKPNNQLGFPLFCVKYENLIDYECNISTSSIKVVNADLNLIITESNGYYEAKAESTPYNYEPFQYLGIDSNIINAKILNRNTYLTNRIDYVIDKKLYTNGTQNTSIVELSPDFKEFSTKKNFAFDYVTMILLNDGRVLPAGNLGFSGNLFDYSDKYLSISPLINQKNDFILAGHYPVYDGIMINGSQTIAGPVKSLNEQCVQLDSGETYCINPFISPTTPEIIDLSIFDDQINGLEIADFFSNGGSLQCVITKTADINGKTWFCKPYTPLENLTPNDYNYYLIGYLERLSTLQTNGRIFKKFVRVNNPVGISNGICAIATDNKMYCLDPNHNTTVNNLSYTDIISNGIIDCGITTTGRVSCWYSDLNNNMNGSYPLFNVPAGSYKKMQISEKNLCVLSNTGRISCFGENANALNQINTSSTNIDFIMTRFPIDLCWITSE